MGQLWLHSADSLHDGGLDVVQHSLRVMAHLLDVLERESQTAFVPKVIFFTPVILDEIARHFIDCVVSQVHKQVVEIALVWRAVLAGGKPTQSLFVEQDAQRIHAAEEYVDAQVEL